MRSMIPVFTMSLLLLTACSSEKGSDAAPPGSTVVGGSSSAYGSGTVDFDSVEVGSSDLNTISTTAAKNIVLRRANTTENAVEGYKIVSNYDKGYLEYHITFWVDTVEHFYIVLGSDGTVISFSTVFHASGYDPELDAELPVEEEEQVFEAAAEQLTSTQVREILAKHAGVPSSEMMNMIITEGFNGSIPQYQVTFSTTTTSYLYYIAANTGMIFSSDQELIPVVDEEILLPENLEVVPDIVVPEVTPSLPVEPETPMEPEVSEEGSFDEVAPMAPPDSFG